MVSENKFNPYAAPELLPETAPAEREPTEGIGPAPPLPIKFSVPGSVLFTIVPGAGISGTCTVWLAMNAIELALGQYAILLLSLFTALIAVFCGAATFSLLAGVRDQITLAETEIVRTSLSRVVIPYSQITSWHYHPVTKIVHVTTVGGGELTPISNWAMNPDRSKIVGAVLLAKVGPPSG